MNVPTTTTGDHAVSRSFLTRIIDGHNPGVTMLLLVWLGGLTLRMWLDRAGMLTDLTDDALRSLIYVVPVMLVGWAALAIANTVFKLGLFKTPNRR